MLNSDKVYSQYVFTYMCMTAQCMVYTLRSVYFSIQPSKLYKMLSIFISPSEGKCRSYVLSRTALDYSSLSVGKRLQYKKCTNIKNSQSKTQPKIKFQ